MRQRLIVVGYGAFLYFLVAMFPLLWNEDCLRQMRRTMLRSLRR